MRSSQPETSSLGVYNVRWGAAHRIGLNKTAKAMDNSPPAGSVNWKTVPHGVFAVVHSFPHHLLQLHPVGEYGRQAVAQLHMQLDAISADLAAGPTRRCFAIARIRPITALARCASWMIRCTAWRDACR